MPWTKKWFQFSILLILAFIWGSSFILMKVGLKSFTSPQVATLRVGFAWLVLLPMAIQNLRHLRRKDIKSLLIAGFIGNFIPALLFTKAQTRIDSSLAGMLNSMTPVFTLVVGLLFYHIKFKAIQIFGVLLGLLGAVGLIAFGSGIKIGHVNSYALLIVLATSCYALNINEVKARLTHLNGKQITSLSFFFTGPVAIVYFFTSDVASSIQNDGWPWHLAGIALLGILGTAVAMLMMNSLIRYSSAVFASSVTYIIPVFAILWGLMDGELVTLYHLIFMGVILLGVYMINRVNK